MMNSERLRAFLRFAETLNFTRAAEVLHVSQPALHVQVRKLADDVGRPLYRRVPGGLALTEAGQRLYEFGIRQEQRNSAFLAEVHAISSPLVLAAGEGAFLYWLGPAIRAFARSHAQGIRVLTADAQAAVQCIVTGRAHVAVAAEVKPETGIELRPALHVGAKLVATKGHPALQKRTLSLADLRDYPVIAPPPGRPFRSMLEAAFSAAGVAWTPGIEANGWPLMLHFAKLGLGVAIVNDFCTLPSGLRARPLPMLPSVVYSILLPESATPDARRMAELIAKTASDCTAR